MAYIDRDPTKRKKHATHTFYGNRHTRALLEIRQSLSKPPNSTIGPHLTINFESLDDGPSEQEEFQSTQKNKKAN